MVLRLRARASFHMAVLGNACWVRFAGDIICSLSLLSDYNINYKNYIGERTGDRFDLNLPRRSLLVLSGDARYNWKHGILSKTFDYCADGSIRLRLVFIL